MNCTQLIYGLGLVEVRMDQWILLIVLFALGIQYQCNMEIPSFFKICHQDDPNLNECIKESIEALKPFLKKGIPEFFIPTCEPLEIPLIEFNQGTDLAFIVSTFTNISIKGITNFTIKQIDVNVEENNIKLKLLIPQLLLTANYNVNGKILILPIKGDGKSNGNFSKINADVKIHGEEYQDASDENQTHYRVDDVKVILNINDGRIYLGNLFNDKILSDAMNKFLIENWEIIVEEFKPAIEIKIGNVIKQFANQIFTKYSLNNLLPS